MVILKESSNLENKLNENSSIEEIFTIINNNSNAQEWVDFIQNNLDFFSWKNFTDKLIYKLKTEKNSEKKSMILFILSFIYKLNENSEEISTKIANIVKEYQTKLNNIVWEKTSIEEQKKWIESWNKQLVQKLNSKEEELNLLNEILNSFWIKSNLELKNKLKNSAKLVKIFEILENDWTFKKWDNILEIVNRLNKSHTALEKFINILVEQWILLRVANSKELPKINNTALNAVKKTKIYEPKNNPVKENIDYTDSDTNSQIIRAWENTANIKKFQLKEFEQSEEIDEQETDKNEEINSEDVKLMMDRIYELEQKAQQDSQKIKQLEEESLKQKEKYKKLEKKHKKELEEKEKEIQARIIEAIANYHSKKS